MSRIRFTAGDVCRAIDALDKSRLYGYLNEKNHGEIQLVRVILPEGPIIIRRRSIGGMFARDENISSNMIWRVANALDSRLPVNVDRVLAGSYNTRSVLESLLAHTAEIFTCRPGRLENINGQISVKRGHKHIMFFPDSPHQMGVTAEIKLGDDCVISETPTHETMYDVVPPPNRDGMAPEIRRRHSQIQVALAEIANSMMMRTWLAVEDHGIIHNKRNILEYPFIVKDLASEPVISNYHGAMGVGKHIDCLLFNGGLPFAVEVEHTTGVTSGLDRMLRFKNEAPYLNTHFVIVAPDEDRSMVFDRANPSQFGELNPYYMPYSNVEELYSFTQRHRGMLKGVGKDFLMTFMEPCRSGCGGANDNTSDASWWSTPIAAER